MLNIPHDLKIKIQSGEIVLFVGQSLSEAVGIPTVNQLADMLGRRIGCPDNVGHLRKLQFYENSAGRPELIDFFREKLDTRFIKPSPAHYLITQLPSKIIFTTTYDNLLEKALSDAKIKFHSVVVGSDLPYGNRDEVSLFKLYGSLDHTGSITLTQNDHMQYASKNTLLIEKLKTLLVGQTFLFIGFDPMDFGINQLYSSIELLLKENQRKAYAITVDASEFDIAELSNRNINVLNYKSNDFGSVAAAQAFPLSEFVEYVQEAKAYNLSEATTPAKKLANEVKSFLLSMGHIIIPNSYLEQNRAIEFITAPGKRDEQSVEFLALEKYHGTKIKRLYRCVDGSVGSSDVLSVSKRLETRKDADEAWLITFRDGLITHQARQLAEEFSQINVMPIARFYRELIHFEDYLQDLIKEYESGDIPKYFINIACKVPQYDENRFAMTGFDTYDNLDNYIDSWLDSPTSNHISILGDFGTGKTWFCKKYAAKLARLYLSDPDHRRLPIYIPLREFKKIQRIEDLITSYLVNKCGIDLPGGFSTFQHLNRYDGLLLILDGFDEMIKSADDEITVKNFEELAKVVESGTACKVILSCRTSYFKSNLQERELLSGEGQNALLDLRNRPNFDLIYLQDFDNERIQALLRLRTAQNWENVWKKIREVYDLGSLAQRPVLLNMIVETFDNLVHLQKIDKSILYDQYTSNWIQRQADDERTLVTPELKKVFMQEIAWYMYEHNDYSIHYNDIDKLLIEKFTFETNQKIDHYEHEIRAQSFLVRATDGYYAFSHASFLEYYVARKLKDAILKADFETLGKEYISDGVYGFLSEMIDEKPAKKQLLAWLEDANLPISTRRNCMVFLSTSIDNETADKLRIIYEREGEISIAIRIAIALRNFGQKDLLEGLVQNLDKYDVTTGHGPSKTLAHSLSISRGQNLAIDDEVIIEKIASKLLEINNEHMKRTLLLVLGHSKSINTQKPVQDLLVKSDDLRTQRYAIATLGQLANIKSIPLLEQYKKHPNNLIQKDVDVAIEMIKARHLKASKDT